MQLMGLGVIIVAVIILMVLFKPRFEHLDATSAMQDLMGKKLTRTGEMDGVIGAGYPMYHKF
jgi:type II secretory pathway component PulM